MDLAVYLHSFFKGFFRIVPGAAGVVLEDAHQYAANSGACQEAAQGFGSDNKTDGEREEKGNCSGKDHFLDGRLRRNGNTFIIFGFAGAFHDPGDGTELPSYFLYHCHGSLSYGLNTQRRENEGDHTAYEEAGQNFGLINVDALDSGYADK